MADVHKKQTPPWAKPAIVAGTIGVVLGITIQHLLTEHYVLPKWRASAEEYRAALHDCQRWQR